MVYIYNFMGNFDRHQKVLLLLGGLPLPFDNTMATPIKHFIPSIVSKKLQIKVW